MFDCKMIVNSLCVNENKLNISLAFSCAYNAAVTSPKGRVFFQQDNVSRRMPIPVSKYVEEKNGLCTIECEYTYLVDKIFFKTNSSSEIKIRIDFYYGEEELIGVKPSFPSGFELDNSSFGIDFQNNLIILKNINTAKRKASLINTENGLNRAAIVGVLRKPVLTLFRWYYKLICRFNPIVQNRITFMSCRREKMGGNPDCVYQLIKDNGDIDFKFLLYSDSKGHRRFGVVRKFLYLYATSRAVVVDDYFRLLNIVDKREGVKLFQLWHACGAFKTFGFSRLGKLGGPKQQDVNHRMYDCAIVSSQEIAKHYAEGFGLSDECVFATGIPRTDIFMDEEYSKGVKEAFFNKYPQLKEKKILLFAPTFRGIGQVSAYYPLDKLNPSELYESLGEEYAVIIKLHPFCKERYQIEEKYKDYIIDLSEESELNDLLFVTDLLITDYSSVIFEASLLNIPMLFYAYDLDEYISGRDFYYEFKTFVPGKIVQTKDELIDSIKTNSFDKEKIDSFKTRFFDSLDGKSSERVANIILKALSERRDENA